MEIIQIFLKYLLITATMALTISTLLVVSYGVTSTGSAGFPLFAYFSASIGLYLMATGFVGTFAGLKDSRILSLVYVGLSAIGIFFLTIYMIIFACKKDDLMEATRFRVENAWRLVGEGEPDEMNKVQDYYQCCGMEGPDDYKQGNNDFPISCCLTIDCSKEAGTLFENGCFDDVMDTFAERTTNLMYSCLGTIFIIVLGAAAAYFYSKTIVEEKMKADIIEIPAETK